MLTAGQSFRFGRLLDSAQQLARNITFRQPVPVFCEDCHIPKWFIHVHSDKPVLESMVPNSRGSFTGA
jgi:hypothetical protein